MNKITMGLAVAGFGMVLMQGTLKAESSNASSELLSDADIRSIQSQYKKISKAEVASKAKQSHKVVLVDSNETDPNAVSALLGLDSKEKKNAQTGLNSNVKADTSEYSTGSKQYKLVVSRTSDHYQTVYTVPKYAFLRPKKS